MIKNSSINNRNSIKSAFIYSYKLLNKKERTNIRKNIILSFLAGIFEIISVTSVYPLVSIIIEPELIEKNKYIYKLWYLLGTPPQNQFVILLSLGASLILVFSVLINLISQILSVKDSSSAEERLSKEFYKSVIYSNYKWHLSNNPNVIRTIILTNINLWNRSIIRIIPSLAGQFSGIIFAVLTIIFATPKLGLILFIASGVSLSIILKFVRKKSNKLMYKFSENQSLINIFLSESLTGIKDLKLSSNEENFIKIFSNLNHIIIKNFSAATNWNSLPGYIVIIFGQLSILITAATLFISGVKGGELASIMAIIVLVFSRTIPLFSKLGGSLTNISNYSDFIEKIIISKESLEKAKRKIINKEKYNLNNENLNWSKVKFSEVEFSYDKSTKPVLKKLTLEICKGLHYAFIGSSGSGKSTTIDLFLGLLEPTKGKILIDQTDLKEIGSRKWQSKISYVPQDPLIADLSLRENIAFGIPPELIDNNKIMLCLKKTYLLEVAKSLEKGIYTNLGNKGIKLSGGQKQRVALARALYQNSEILVLDEATSSLDSRTEELIQETIKNLKQKMTILSIAHRFSTIKNCDFIFLLDNGNIKEKGTFENMKKKLPLFSRTGKIAN